MIEYEVENAYVTEYSDLWAASLTREMHGRTCGYWYTITNGSTAHTAFRTRVELDTWLAERGLTLLGALPKDIGVHGSMGVIGKYRRLLDRDVDRFDKLVPVLTTTVWDNGERVPAKITDADGVRTVHVVNVNYRNNES